MDYNRCLLTMFFAGDESFAKHLSDQPDDAAIQDVSVVKRYMNFLLALLLRAKDKLETLGHCYEPLSQDFRALMRVRGNNEDPLVKVHDRPLLDLRGAKVRVDQGYLSDFVVSMVRLEKELELPAPPPTTPFIDPRADPFMMRMLDILRGASPAEDRPRGPKPGHDGGTRAIPEL